MTPPPGAKTDSLFDLDEDLGNLELPDIIDIDALQVLMNHFQKLTGMVFAILDLKGNVLVAAGMNDYIAKPVDRVSLLEAIGRVVAGKMPCPIGK